ncbi:MAG: M48 family metallopeptidase [Bacteroidales bacterium]|nr:M48 family metallopeptidase [Bacteroidales bacterium]
MRKSIIFLCFIVWNVTFISAQVYVTNFTPLQSEGEIPSDFKDLINKNTNEADFNLFLKEMFLRGNILYGSKLNQYINTIADNLLKEYPGLRQDLRFYILQSPVVNAAATENGIILINVGLIAQVSNESELAFIISHEIIHYVEHHIIKMNNYEDVFNKNRNEYKEFYLKYHNRSRENELEADKLGLERYYQHSPYSYKALNGVFDVLQYAEFPFDEIPFQRTYVETNFYQFSDNYFLSTVTPIRIRDDNVDTLSTHPNIQKRRAVIQRLISGLSDEGRKLFVQSEELFNEIRNLARFQCIHIFLIQHQYDDAFYNTYILEQKFPNNTFLLMTKAASLYALYQYKSQGQLSDIVENYKKAEGEIQQINYFFSKLNKKEMAVLALRNAWKAYKNDRENIYLLNITKDLMKKISIDNKMDYIDFSDYAMGVSLDSIPVERETIDTVITTTKYERIKKQSKGGKVKPSDKFQTVNYMLVDLRKDADFMNVWETVVKASEDEEIHAIIKDKNAYNISKLLIVNPYYFIFSKKNNPKTFLKNYAKAEIKSEKLSKTIQTSINKLHLETEFYSNDVIKQFTTVDYNQYATIQAWIQDYISSDNIKMIYYQSNYTRNITQATGYNALSLIVVGQSTAIFVNGHKLLSTVGTILCPVIGPVTLTTIALPRKKVWGHIKVINFETGETLYYESMEAESVVSDAYLHSFIYNVYAKIKQHQK